MKVPKDTFDLISCLPGEEFIATGLMDLEKGIYTSEDALLILIAKTRLERGGLHCLKELKGPLPVNPEATLYQILLKSDHDNAYGRYNSLKRRLVSFASALDHRQRLNKSIPV